MIYTPMREVGGGAVRGPLDALLPPNVAPVLAEPATWLDDAAAAPIGWPR